MATIKDLGIVSAYGYAKSKGYTGTEEEFAILMDDYADVADIAEAWAVGTRAGVPVAEGDETYHNNSKYYAEQAAGSASDASDSAGAASRSAGAAKDSEDAAAASEAAAKDYSDHIADPVSGLVTGWLNDHVDPDTGYVIDNTLTVQNAAADAKKVGDELTDVKSALTYFNRITQYGLIPYLGGLVTINADTTVDYGKVYYDNDSNTQAYKKLMAYNGNAWEFVLGGITIDDISNYTVSLASVKNDISSTSANDKTYARVLDRVLQYGLNGYSGGLVTINADASADHKKVYYNSNTAAESYKKIMWYDGSAFVWFFNLTIDDVSEYLEFNTLSNLADRLGKIEDSIGDSNSLNVSLTWESGNLNGGTGAKEASSNTIRSSLTQVDKYGIIIVTVDDGYTYAVRGYAGDTISSDDFAHYSHTFISTKTVYFQQEGLSNCKNLAFCLRKAGIATTDASHLHIKRISTFDNVREYIDEKTSELVDDSNTSNNTTWSSTKISGLFTEVNSDILEIQSEIDAPVSVSDALAAKLATAIEYNRNQKYVNIGFFTDTHSNEENAQFSIGTMNAIMLTKMMNHCVHGGDLITTYNLNYAQYIKAMCQNMTNYKKYGDLLFVKGNHDNNHATVLGDNATKYQYHMMMQSHLSNAVFNSIDPCACYYYVDCPHELVRIIVLDTYTVEGDSATVAIDDTQNTWLYSVALDVEDGWTVIIFAHQFTSGLEKTIQILNAFNDRGTEYGDYSFPTTISTQFVGVIHGHTHSDDYSNALGFNNIGVTKAFAANGGVGAVDVFTIDTTAHRLYETRIGDGNSRLFAFDTPSQLS